MEENKRGYTPKQFEKAKVAKKLYHNLGSPTIENFKALLRMNTIQNNTIILENVRTAEAIFELAMSTLKGKTTRSTPCLSREMKLRYPKK